MSELDKQQDTARIERFKAGDPSAFEEIMRAHQDRVYNLCRRILENSHDAEDAAQDVFVKAFQNLSRFRPDASLATWLYRIAVNTCIDYRRKPWFESLFKKSSDGREVMIDAPSDQPSPERLLESRRMDEALHVSLAKLSPKLRAVVVLREVDGLSYEEISEVMSISIGTVKSRLSRAREELLEQMGSW